ncbi:hypothetical protein AALP_AA5G292200 [Arabis alpina]|uniref:DUF4378 domain-containing protein n=1 Tax=Arabis alpina TaxID=50452 RepID=A0A087H044_ARAAL|nr:hypothetical protein AALP_AA5G292200 [Arabis alpina]
MEMKEQDNVQIGGGCMAGFFNIFDRPNLLSPKRISSAASSEPASPSKDSVIQSTPDLRTRSPLTFPVMEFKHKSPWRFSKEAPRLSLDSRAVVDDKGSLKPRQREEDNQRGSPSVIARLMGLEEPLPSAQPLQRSASESRVRRFVDTFNFQNQESDVKGSSGQDPVVRRTPPQRRQKTFFDSEDFFPEARRMSPPPSDLETLKQLLEALRLKGLLHSSNKQRRNQHGMGNHQSPPIRSRSRALERRRSPNRQQRRVSPLRPEPLQIRGASEEMWNVDEHNRQGKTLLERCDKLLQSIAEMAASEANDSQQPSPVSVLDASLYHEDSSPSPVMKRTLDFTESEEDESWSGSLVSVSSSDSEYVYISDILRASDCIPQESDIFSFLDKHQYLKGKQNIIPQERRLIFDAVQEIVGRRKRLPPWRRLRGDDKMEVVWSEFQKMRKTRSESSQEDLVGYVCGVLRRDLSEDRWRDCEVDMSEAVLDIERLIFKDLIDDTIRHLAALNRSHSLRRRLLFF